MTYETKGDDMIYYQNGMNNSLEEAREGAGFISVIAGESVGVINNKTHGLAKDSLEYLPDTLTLKDALTAKTYEDISKNGEDKNLVVMFSAGNEDAYKALEVLALENRSLILLIMTKLVFEKPFNGPQ